MFYIRTSLKESPLHGIGLFSGENIAPWTKIYAPNPELDLFISPEKFLTLSNSDQETIQHYGYLDSKSGGGWHLAFDDIRFCNHSSRWNITLKQGILYANRAIKAGEELTQNYEEFESLRSELSWK